jgi:hypothetical protein
MTLKADILAHLDALLTTAQRLDDSFRIGDYGSYESNIPEAEHRAFVTSAKAAIRRIAGNDSEYFKALPEITNGERITVPGYSPTTIPAVRGSLDALRDAVDSGLLTSIESLLRANFHDDFLDQSQSLLDAGYHVAAMVLIGGVLEDHMQRLCINRSLVWSGTGSLSKYNDALRTGTIYAQPTWRRIQSIGDVRNDAAHGNGVKVAQTDVDDAQKYVRRFLSDHPA